MDCTLTAAVVGDPAPLYALIDSVAGPGAVFWPDVDPLAYLGDILARLAQGYPINRVAELLPWRWAETAKTLDM